MNHHHHHHHQAGSLREPLLGKKQEPSTEESRRESDEELGAAAKDDSANNSNSTSDSNNNNNNAEENDTTPSVSDEVPIRKRAYRPTTIHVVVLDLLIVLGLGFFIKGKSFLRDFHHFSFASSVIDILWMTILRAKILLVQSSMSISLRATKIARYISLVSFLYMITKVSCASSEGLLDWHRTSLPYTILLLSSTMFCLTECICEIMVSFFSSQDLASSVAPTEDEAAEGIAVDETKRIEMWELLKVLKPYFWPEGLLNRICVFMTWVFLIFSKVSNILAPLFIAKATDDLTAGKMSTTTKHIIIYAVLLLSNKAFKELQAISYIRVKLIAGVQLQENVFTHILSLSMDWHQRKSMGAVNTAMDRGINASNMVVQYIFLYLLPTMIEAGVVIIVFIEAFRSPLLAAVAISGCTLYTVVTIELTLFRMQFRKRMNKAYNDVSHKVTDALMNIETIKYFTAESHEVNRYRDNVDIVQDSAYKIQGSLSILNTTQQTVLNSTLVTALLVAAHEYTTGELTIGQFVAVNVYIMQLFAPLNFLGSIYSMAVGSYVDLQNLCNILAEKPDIEDREDAQELDVVPSTPLDIEFRDVLFRYPSRREVDVLKGISFKIPAGTTTAVVGATGAGKSTITRLLFRFYEADQGQVLVGGRNVLNLTQKSLRRNLGVVPQDHILFNDTLAYNIRYGSRDASDDDVREAIRSAELDDFISELPKGLDTVVGERGQQVSGGQKQRIAIARVLIKDCPICVLDEATSSLDSRTEMKIQKALESLSGRTMLIIAHRLSTIQHAQQIIVMSNGNILEVGSHDTLLSKGTWHEQCYASLWDKQKKSD